MDLVDLAELIDQHLWADNLASLHLIKDNKELILNNIEINKMLVVT